MRTLLAPCLRADAANGLKSDFGGQHNNHENNVYAWVNNCWGSGNSDRFINNTCVSNTRNGGFASDCHKGPLMIVSGNQIYNQDGSLGSTSICDASNVMAGAWPSVSESMRMAKDVLLW